MNELNAWASPQDYQIKQSIASCEMSNRNPTVAENIDIKIKALQNEIDRLEASKIALAPLMNMRIRDIRDAMSF